MSKDEREVITQVGVKPEPVRTEEKVSEIEENARAEIFEAADPVDPNLLPEELTEEEIWQKRVIRRARLATILERGRTVDRLHVELPEDVHGEWVPNEQKDILHYESLGFEIDTQYAAKRALHSDGTGKAIIGDVIYMICSRELKEDLDAVKAERYERRHGRLKASDRGGKAQVEERAFANQVDSKLGMPTIDESEATIANADDIRSAVQQSAKP